MHSPRALPLRRHRAPRLPVPLRGLPTGNAGLELMTDSADVARGSLDRLCVGNVLPTAWRLARFQVALIRLCFERFGNVLHNDRRKLVRLRPMRPESD